MCAAVVRAALRAYTYPYRKRFASLSRSVALKNRSYSPPKGFAFARERHGGVPVEKVTPPNAKAGAVLQFHGGGHTAPMNDMYRKAAKRLAANCGCTVYSIDYRTGASLVYPAVHDECCRGYAALCKTVLADGNFVAVGDSFGANLLLSSCLRAREDGLRCRLGSSAFVLFWTWRPAEILTGRMHTRTRFMPCRSALTLKDMKKISAVFRRIAATRLLRIRFCRLHTPNFTSSRKRLFKREA